MALNVCQEAYQYREAQNSAKEHVQDHSKLTMTKYKHSVSIGRIAILLVEKMCEKMLKLFFFLSEGKKKGCSRRKITGDQ